MHSKSITIALLLFGFQSLFFPALSQSNISGRWKCDLAIEEYSMGPFTMFLDFFSENDTSFYAYSTENADKRIAGSFKASLGRAFHKSPKKGVFISIKNGKILHYQQSDSLFGEMAIPMIGMLDFSSLVSNNKLSGILTDSSGNEIAAINGITAKTSDKMDFRNLINRIADTTKSYIFNPYLLESNKWKKFQRKLNKLSLKVQDDVELFFGFNMLSPKLPFSHYNLFIFNNSPNDIMKENSSYVKNIFLEEKNNQTIYMNIKSFGGTATEMDSAFKTILSKNYKYLIIDLRENPGGGLNSAIPFGEYLIDSALYTGCFLTHDWFNKHKEVKTSGDFADLPVTHSRETDEFINELKVSAGRRLVLYPGKNKFQGKIFVLTSKKTASTCEPIVYALKRKNIATVVGENTAGAMLSAAIITVKSKYKLFLPIADFYTFDGKRLDQVGVSPDIEVRPDEALDYVLENLIQKKI